MVRHFEFPEIDIFRYKNDCTWAILENISLFLSKLWERLGNVNCYALGQTKSRSDLNVDDNQAIVAQPCITTTSAYLSWLYLYLIYSFVMGESVWGWVGKS